MIASGVLAIVLLGRWKAARRGAPFIALTPALLRTGRSIKVWHMERRR